MEMVARLEGMADREGEEHGHNKFKQIYFYQYAIEL